MINTHREALKTGPLKLGLSPLMCKFQGSKPRRGRSVFKLDPTWDGDAFPANPYGSWPVREKH